MLRVTVIVMVTDWQGRKKKEDENLDSWMSRAKARPRPPFETRPTLKESDQDGKDNGEKGHEARSPTKEKFKTFAHP